MTNSLAIALALAIAGFVCLDIFLYDARNLLFLGKELFDLIEWLAFWR